MARSIHTLIFWVRGSELREYYDQTLDLRDKGEAHNFMIEERHFDIHINELPDTLFRYRPLVLKNDHDLTR